MKHLLQKALLGAAVLLCTSEANAQLSTNPDKFLGNITTSYQVDFGNEPFHKLWNQITPENETKWGSIEGQRRGQFDWGNSDNIYDYARQHGFPMKFHTLVWGSQYPGWMNNLSTDQQLLAIEEWMDAVKARYPDMPMFDVVNEAIGGHAPAPYKEALGGDGATGYDWIIRAFEMAHERWPEAILIYNDYNTFRWQKAEFIDLVRTLRDAGAPIDAYGCQSHDLNDMDASMFKAAMTDMQNQLQMPMYITEYDISHENDDLQLQRYKEQLPYMWEAPYCAGVTLWGYIYGRTWSQAQYSGLIRDGQDRPAMTFLRQYMASDAAKKAKSPFPGMKKEASVYVKCSKLKVDKGENVDISMRASLRTKTIDHIDLYINNQLIGTYANADDAHTAYTPNATGRYDVKAVVVATDGTRYERLSGFNALSRSIHNGTPTLPGTIEAEDFDGGSEGYTFHDSDLQDEGNTHYRSDNGGVDIVTGNGSHALGYTAAGEWTEYTVNVSQTGDYTFEAYASSGTTGSGFSIAIVKDGVPTRLAKVNVSQTGNNSWDTYKAFSGKLSMPLEAGQQRLRIIIDNPYCNIDKIVLKYVEGTGINDVLSDDADAQNEYNLSGQRVGSNYRGIIVSHGKKIMRR
jgi:GH35 family endo-1,4-beta-xylanase